MEEAQHLRILDVINSCLQHYTLYFLRAENDINVPVRYQGLGVIICDIVRHLHGLVGQGCGFLPTPSISTLQDHADCMPNSPKTQGGPARISDHLDRNHNHNCGIAGQWGNFARFHAKNEAEATALPHSDDNRSLLPMQNGDEFGMRSGGGGCLSTQGDASVHPSSHWQSRYTNGRSNSCVDGGSTVSTANIFIGLWEDAALWEQAPPTPLHAAARPDVELPDGARASLSWPPPSSEQGPRSVYASRQAAGQDSLAPGRASGGAWGGAESSPAMSLADGPGSARRAPEPGPACGPPIARLRSEGSAGGVDDSEAGADGWVWEGAGPGPADSHPFDEEW